MDERARRTHGPLTHPFLRVPPANDPTCIECAACDANVARAVEAMRAHPTRRWTLAALARVAGLSRAAFARRFHRAVGQPPLRWLAGHRFELACSRLVNGDAPLAVIAADVGYSSEFAFSKAFKRHLGIAPGAFRRAFSGDGRPFATSTIRAAA